MMRSIYAVYRREMGHYFVSPLAYVIVGVFLTLTAFFFFYFLSAVNDQALRMDKIGRAHV
jgi:ABC-type transport system involved in multi-copper enzyme maturation permease subunit